MEVVQRSFGAGMNSIALDTNIQPDAFVWGVNVRPRFSDVSPINKHTELDLPTGATKLQGCIGVGNTLVIFADGKAYWRIPEEGIWNLIPLFQMSTTAPTLWSCSVPASNMSFVRKLALNGNIKSDIQLTTDFQVSGTPAAIVVQDGINQPYLVFFDTVNQVFSARPAKSYFQWSNVSTTQDDREYVPRGKQMLFMNDCLFIVSLDSKKVYRSVSGRPLDFVINVDINGNKAVSETEGGADALSFAFDFDLITGLYAVNTPNSFAYSTASNVRIITLDYTQTLFSEPTFYRSATIDAGVVNDRSFIDILGDYAFIDSEGIISFNAVEQLQNNGRNSVFSLNVSKFLQGVKQKRPVAFRVNNYAMFNVDSTMGNVILVYDMLLENWVSIDITDITAIKEVAYVETVNASYIYCVTWHNEVFELFSNIDEVYLAQIRTKANIPALSTQEQKTTLVRPIFKGGFTAGQATVIEYVDDIEGQRIDHDLAYSVSSILYPVRPPVIPHTLRQVDNPQYTYTQGQTGKKIHFIIQWQTNARLFEFQFNSVEQTKNTSVEQGNTFVS